MRHRLGQISKIFVALALWAVHGCSSVGILGGGGDRPRAGDDDDPLYGDLYQEPPIESSTPRRLTPAEYRNTLDDVFGIDATELTDSFPLEASTAGFRNQLDAFQISPVHVQWFASAARQLAERIVASKAFKSRFSDSCRDESRACLEKLTGRIGRLLFRRPLDKAQIRVWTDLVAVTLESGDSLDDGLRLMLEGMLQAPEFLYRLEVRAKDGSARTLDSYEVATRLSYFVWHSAPDEALLDAAAKGSLESHDGIRKAVRRMLDDDRARRAFRAYVAEWLQLSRLGTVDRDPASFPLFRRELLADMREETLRLFEAVAFDREAPFTEVFVAPYTFATPGLAAIYGLRPAGEGFRRYGLSPDDGRVGFLMQAAFLTLSSVTAQSDPVGRGHLVTDRFLCIKTPEAPAGVIGSEEAKGDTRSKRERLEVHRASRKCAVCHQNMDPVGFAFERFDTIGAWRDVDETGAPVDASGALPPDESGSAAPFRDAIELAELLAADARTTRCVAKRAFEYAVGYQLRPSNAELVRVADAFLGADLRYKALVEEIAVSALMRTVKDGKGDDP